MNAVENRSWRRRNPGSLPVLGSGSGVTGLELFPVITGYNINY